MSMIHFRQRGVNTGTGPVFSLFGIFGNQGASGVAVSCEHWLPLAATLKKYAMCFATAPGTGKSYAAQARIGNANNAATATVADTATDTDATFNVALPQGLNASFLTTQVSISTTLVGSPALQQANEAFQYLVDSQPDISWHWFNNPTQNVTTVDGTSRFFSFTWSGLSGASTTTEATAQVPWPRSGKFKYLTAGFGGGGIAVGTTVRLALRVNGVDSGLVLDCAGTGASALYSDLATEVTIAAGDLICWRYVRQAGAGSPGMTAALLCGFRATD